MMVKTGKHGNGNNRSLGLRGIPVRDLLPDSLVMYIYGMFKISFIDSEVRGDT
jgi:hypothetical protein